MSVHAFALPDLGEGLTEAEIVAWRVTLGAEVALNDPLVEVETAKAVVEIPSPYAGRVTELLVDAGAAVEVGQLIVRIDDGVPASPKDAASPKVMASAGAGASAEGADGREPLLVGYGVTSDRRARRRRARTAGTPVPAAAPAPLPAAPAVPPVPGTSAHPRVKPPLRKFAKERGVDLTAVAGSGPGGTITRLDIMTALAPATTAPGSPAPSTEPLGAATNGHSVAAANGRSMAATNGRSAAARGRAGDPAGDQRIPVRGVRAATARAMVASAQVPQVTVFHTVDVTGTVELLAQLRELPEFAGVKVSPLLIVARALLRACRLHPDLNASWDDGTGDGTGDGPVRVVHGAVHLGIAAETDRGLIVPNIRNADRLPLVDLAQSLAALVDTARRGAASPADLTGGTITITNVGVFGVEVGAPLLNPGEGAILCAGAIEDRPWAHDGALALRPVMRLALTVDHRIIDGALASRALVDIAVGLSHPLRALVS